MIPAAILVAVALSPIALRRLALRRPHRARPVVVATGSLAWMWLIVAGAVALLVAAIIFAAQSVNGYDGDAGPVLSMLFDACFYGGPVIVFAGVVLCLTVQDPERLGD